MYPRLALMHQLLADDGSLYLHVDHRAAHYLKILLDEIFGRENFQREIIWRIGWVSGLRRGRITGFVITIPSFFTRRRRVLNSAGS
jgi:LmbE family N-acetylglucosaminyl deacetylase